MFTQQIADSPTNRRGHGQVSHLILAPGQFGSGNLAVTWVRGAPASQQSLHMHPQSEQVYVIVSGRGQMIVAGEGQEVRAGTLVFIPPGAAHAIHNPGPEELVYVSAAAPPFEMPTGEFAYEFPATG
jgi:mannose-6-phosphate isomerase-like protein (cupin superfamily)